MEIKGQWVCPRNGNRVVGRANVGRITRFVHYQFGAVPIAVSLLYPIAYVRRVGTIGAYPAPFPFANHE